MCWCAGAEGSGCTSMWKLFIARAAAGPAVPPPTSQAGVAALRGASGAPARGGRQGWVG